MVEFGTFSKTTAMPEPKPISAQQKKVFVGMLVVGAIVLALGIWMSMNNDAMWLTGAVCGLGGSMLGIGGIALFHPPDR